jgi:hypothetical protein
MENTRRADRRRGRRAVTLTLFIAMFSLTAVPLAYAHYVYEWPTKAVTDNMCVKVRSEVSHGGGGGYSRGDVQTLSDDPRWTECSQATGHAPFYAATHGIQLSVYKYGSNGWYECMRSDFATRSNAYHSYRDWNYNLPCGPGYYGTYTYGVAQEVTGGSWYGGWVWSGYHYLPA